MRMHPAGGQAECLTLSAASGGPGEILLNRNGTIQVPTRFDGRTSAWEPTPWDDYLRADPRDFVNRLEVASGLPTPVAVPPATPRTLTLRVLAALTATAVKSVHPIEIELGMIDTSGYGAGPYSAGFESFPQIPGSLLEPRADDLFGIAEYRFWFVLRDGVSVLAFEQEQGLAWTPHREAPFDLMKIYVARAGICS